MSLAELRALAETEDQTTEEQAELEIDEPETEVAEDETDAEALTDEEVEEESEDFELELEGEPEPKPKFNAEEALTHKLTKQRKRAQKAESEVETLREELNQLKQAMSGQQPQAAPVQPQVSAEMPEPPDFYSPEINGDKSKYSQAFAKYMADYQRWDEAQKAPAIQAQQQQTQYQETIANKASKLSTDAAKFIQDNKIKANVVIDSIELAKNDVDEAAGLDGAFVHLLDSLDDGAAKVAYHIGRNEAARDKLKSLIKSDPSGLKAVNYLTKLTSLKPKASLSKAPEPDEPIKGDVGSVAASRWKSQYAKETDPAKMLALRRKARAAGVSLD